MLQFYLPVSAPGDKEHVMKKPISNTTYYEGRAVYDWLVNNR